MFSRPPLSSRRWILASLLIVAAGCSRPPEDEGPKIAPDEHADERRALEPGETVKWEFKVDDQWHISPYLAYRTHRLEVRSGESAMRLPPNSIRFLIGRFTQVISDQNQFTVTSPGTILFRVPFSHSGGYRGNVEIEIERIDGQ